jgi:hypothetical protein
VLSVQQIVLPVPPLPSVHFVKITTFLPLVVLLVPYLMQLPEPSVRLGLPPLFVPHVTQVTLLMPLSSVFYVHLLPPP